jgi:hypothetical protein
MATKPSFMVEGLEEFESFSGELRIERVSKALLVLVLSVNWG